jgi:hypothetical protein
VNGVGSTMRQTLRGGLRLRGGASLDSEVDVLDDVLDDDDDVDDAKIVLEDRNRLDVDDGLGLLFCEEEEEIGVNADDTVRNMRDRLMLITFMMYCFLLIGVLLLLVYCYYWCIVIIGVLLLLLLLLL